MGHVDKYDQQTTNQMMFSFMGQGQLGKLATFAC